LQLPLAAVDAEVLKTASKGRRLVRSLHQHTGSLHLHPKGSAGVPSPMAASHPFWRCSDARARHGMENERNNKPTRHSGFTAQFYRNPAQLEQGPISRALQFLAATG